MLGIATFVSMEENFDIHEQRLDSDKDFERALRPERFNDFSGQEKIIDNLQDDVAVAVLQRMEEGASAKILAKLDPAKAARFSNIIFTGRRTVLTST